MLRYIHIINFNDTVICTNFLGTYLYGNLRSIVVVCPDLMDPTNGIITFTGETSGFMTMATYSCNPGYGLSGGDSVRTCTSSSVGPGEWSGTSPTCEGIRT